ncbi:hypothetical protein VNO80_25733 [Phaseolus coccineus]|uniref:Uncharacterized protein n=1 Tax=Phaseolus coccineus TaxID=3886 RepID=A0AAN9LV65_PHACN
MLLYVQGMLNLPTRSYLKTFIFMEIQSPRTQTTPPCSRIRPRHNGHSPSTDGNITGFLEACPDSAMKLLMEVMTDVDAANLMGQRAFDIINNEEIKKNLVRAEARARGILSRPGEFRQIDGAGTTNNSVIQGHGQSDSSKVYEGKSVMSDKAFIAFSSTFLLAFMTSILTIIFLMPRNVACF